MSDESTVSISDAGWTKWLGTYLGALGRNIREGLYEEWPLLMRKVMDFTPPFRAKGKPGPSDLSVGRAAVAFDIYKVMRPFNPVARTKHMETILERRDAVAFDALARKSKNPLMQGLTAVPFSPTLHLNARNARGRVPGRDRRQVVLGSDVALLNAYVAKMQRRVGFAKAGWLPALNLVGGEAPAYVVRQGTGGGSVIDDHANEENPSITAINHTPWAVRKDEGGRILSDAKASRIESIIAKIKTASRLADQKAKAG